VPLAAASTLDLFGRARRPELVELGVKIIDMSGDFRLRDVAASRPHGAPRRTVVLSL
jgi:N-acetyl-gamma-glutamylphosphate reductase